MRRILQSRRRKRKGPHSFSRSWLPVVLIGVAALGYHSVDLFAPAVRGTETAGNIVGAATVVDGDSLKINGIRIRLLGIDAPESRQSCTIQGREYHCGREATVALKDKIGGNSVECEQKGVDRYKRVIAVCRAGGEDLNGWMVREGWALAYRRYSRAYVDHEKTASNKRAGLWRGEFMFPWDWRKHERRPK